MNKSPAVFLKSIYYQRRERNPSYSLSAFSRDLGFSLSIVSRVMASKRPVSLKMGLQISNVLDLDQNDRNEFISQILRHLGDNAKVSARLKKQILHTSLAVEAPLTEASVDTFDPISDWYHIAILNLLRLSDFDADPEWISDRLNITTDEARSSLEKLLSGGFVEVRSGKLVRKEQNLSFRARSSKASIRKFHSQMIHKALLNLENHDEATFNNRMITGVTLACSKDQIETMKDKIEKFQEDLISFLARSSESPDALYQFNIQLFPFTSKEKL
jgi:uncharacterized protein (TIGR02147 family)